MADSILDSLKGTFASNNATAPAEKANSEYWLNIGYMADDNQHFVSLPKGGTPVDNISEEEVKDPTSDYGQLLLAGNELLRAIKEKAKSLQPGETCILPLTVQLRRKKVTVTEMPKDSFNKFLKVMNF